MYEGEVGGEKLHEWKTCIREGEMDSREEKRISEGGTAGGVAKRNVMPQGVKKEFLPAAVLSLPVYCLSAASFDW